MDIEIRKMKELSLFPEIPFRESHSVGYFRVACLHRQKAASPKSQECTNACAEAVLMRNEGINM